MIFHGTPTNSSGLLFQTPNSMGSVEDGVTLLRSLRSGLCGFPMAILPRHAMIEVVSQLKEVVILLS